MGIILILSTVIIAKPSGGPYGPLHKSYDLPDVAGNIYFVAPDGEPKSNGENLNNPTTLQSVIAKVETGDAIILRGGTYRTGNLTFNQGITIQPYKDEKPIIKGTLIPDEWRDLGNGLWTTPWSNLFPSEPADWWRRHRQGKKTPLYRFNNDIVFVDGKYLQAVGWEGQVDEDTYYIDYESGTVYIGVDPEKHEVEITAFNNALVRTTEKVHGKTSDGKGPTIRGITFDQYAYRALEVEGTWPVGPKDESEYGKQVVGTTLEHCTISNCSRVAAYLRGDSLTIRHCKVKNTSTEGIYVMSSNDVLLEKNIFTRNNVENITGYYPAAVKIFNQCHRVICRDNLVIDHPNSNGIWYDVGNVNGVFVNNWVENIGHNNKPLAGNEVWPSRNGFMFEISKGAICAGNVFVNCDHGVLSLNSADVHIYQNTFVNSVASISRDERSAEGDHFGWHPSTGPDVEERDGHVFVNNLLVDNDLIRPLIFAWQSPLVCDRAPDPQFQKLDHNVYLRSPGATSASMILWSPAQNDSCQIGINSVYELNKLYPEFGSNSKYFKNYGGPVFRSSRLNNYRLVPNFPGNKFARELPERISKLLNYNKQDPFIGAYPVE